MTIASANSLRPEVVRRISRLELRARHIVEGFLSGIHRSPYFGQSVEFLQHRQYVTGDDLRHVDWKVWAKQDRLYVKQFEEDTNLRCALLVDMSASMSYGQGALNKLDYATTVAAATALLLLRQHDAVGCLTFDDKVRGRIPQRTSTNHLTTIVRALIAEEPRDKTDLRGVLVDAAATYPRRGMIVLLSDLFADVEATITGLRLLRQRGHDVLVLQILDDDELDFPFNAPMRFEGLEMDQHLNCNPRALREGYQEAIGKFLTEIRRSCARHQIDYALVRTSDSLDAALTPILFRRLKKRRR
jgi:uncharacterized protein (DUF58 family)